MDTVEFEFDDDPDRVDRDAVWAFLSEHAYWGRARTRADVEAQLDSAWRVVGCYRADSGAMVGFARAFGDGATCYLADVFVAHAARGRGFGGGLVRAMIEDGPGRGARWLLHTADAHGLYHRFGFAPPDGTLLERPRGHHPTAAAAGPAAPAAPAQVHREFDARVLVRLGAALDAAAPPSLRVGVRLPVDLGGGAMASPDLVVYAPGPADDPARMHRPARDVVLAVDVDSAPDRAPGPDAAPHSYAAAGIPHVWRLRRGNGAPVLAADALDPGTGRHVETARAHRTLSVDSPFPVTVDVAALYA
ncbi:putative restriction endonuclease [Murinocardiopsis flavida]|uniref:Putative restriction endonuclease n=1 Tax=Murinocardiopsis flavida TaxID=645275 RepID=A0A2P8DGE8_9ACTN|nr:Uma2 family endonuclease [Murinocardiopsis flavida]PSK96304.1 putative restriction endonuclease [Murinocardiopsis flavida]